MCCEHPCPDRNAKSGLRTNLQTGQPATIGRLSTSLTSFVYRLDTIHCEIDDLSCKSLDLVHYGRGYENARVQYTPTAGTALAA